MNSVKAELNALNWDFVESCTDATQAYNLFIFKVTHICEKHKQNNPSQRKKKRSLPRKPWITTCILRSIDKKQRLYHKFIHTPSLDNEVRYKVYRNKLNDVIRLSKRLYFAKRLLNNKQSISKTWQILNEILGRNKKSKLPSYINYNGQVVNDNKRIANIFNEYFVNAGLVASNNVQSTQKHFTDYLPPRVCSYLFFSPTNANEIIDIAKGLKSSFSCGYDNINSHFVKQIVHNIVSPLVYILNLSLSTGIVPDPLKVAKVIPVYKKDDSNLVKNYRPISLLPIFSKFLERIVFVRLYKHLEKYNILSKYQFGFRPNHSTEQAVLYAIEKITTFFRKKGNNNWYIFRP